MICCTVTPGKSGNGEARFRSEFEKYRGFLALEEQLQLRKTGGGGASHAAEAAGKQEPADSAEQGL